MVIRGKMALKLDGIAFAKNQLAAGIDAFAPLLASDELNSQWIEESEDHEDDEDERDKDSDDDGEDFYEDEDTSLTDECALLDKLASLTPIPVGFIFCNDIAPGISCWNFPLRISQGNYKGQNGSNACSLIALLLSYSFHKSAIDLPHPNSSLAAIITNLVCSCIELGNDIYEQCRATLPQRYLSIQEAASVLEMWFSSTVSGCLPVRLIDQHNLSTISTQLEKASCAQIVYACLVIEEKSSLFLIATDYVLYINTHCHLPSGAIILRAHLRNVLELCKEIWNIEGYSSQTYGNLTFIEF